MWEGAQPRVQQPALEPRRGSGLPVGLGVEHVNCPGGPGTERFQGRGTFRAKTRTVPGKPKWLVTLEGFQFYHFSDCVSPLCASVSSSGIQSP